MSSGGEDESRGADRKDSLAELDNGDLVGNLVGGAFSNFANYLKTLKDRLDKKDRQEAADRELAEKIFKQQQGAALQEVIDSCVAKTAFKTFNSSNDKRFGSYDQKIASFVEEIRGEISDLKKSGQQKDQRIAALTLFITHALIKPFLPVIGSS